MPWRLGTMPENARRINELETLGMLGNRGGLGRVIPCLLWAGRVAQDVCSTMGCAMSESLMCRVESSRAVIKFADSYPDSVLLEACGLLELHGNWWDRERALQVRRAVEVAPSTRRPTVLPRLISVRRDG